MSRTKKRFFTLIRNFLHDPMPTLLTLSLLAGMLSGAILVFSSNVSNSFLSFLQNVLEYRAGVGFWKASLITIKGILPFYILSISLSFCSLGAVADVLVPFIFSSGYGAFFGYVYSVYHFNGVIYIILTCAFPFALTSVFLIFSLRESARISKLEFSFLRSTDDAPCNVNMRDEMRLTLFRQFFFLVFLILSAFLQSLFLTILRGVVSL